MKIHFEHSAETRPSMQFRHAQVESVLGRTPGLADGKSFTFNGDRSLSDGFLAEAEVLVVSAPVDLADLPARAPRLRWLHVMAAGVDAVLRAVPEGVALTNVRGAHAARAGEFGITAILMLNNRIPMFASQQRERLWRQSAQTGVGGKTLVILGMGTLGGASAKWARAFGMRVIGVSRSGRAHEQADEVVAIDRMSEVLPLADFLLITLPRTPATENIVDRAALDLLPSHAGVINIGRGEVLMENHLVEKLCEGTLSGAVLDVFRQEPLPADSDLWDVPNLFITPHNGLDDPAEFAVRCLEVFAANLEAYTRGEPLRTPVDRAHGY